jgi:hypothetical protein
MICIKEVGVDLELCVHAHGNDVDHLGSFLQNDDPSVEFFRYPLKLILCSYGSDHAVLIQYV